MYYLSVFPPYSDAQEIYRGKCATFIPSMEDARVCVCISKAFEILNNGVLNNGDTETLEILKSCRMCAILQL